METWIEQDASDRIREYQVRMTCGHLATRKMRPSTAAGCERNGAGELVAPFSKCPDCGGPDRR